MSYNRKILNTGPDEWVTRSLFEVTSPRLVESMAFTPVLGNFKQEGLKKQVVNNVLCFSSQYGASQSYAASNLVGDKYNYPSYGDFTQAFVLVGKLLSLYLILQLNNRTKTPR